MELHVISAKKFGYDKGYDYIAFPADQYTRESAMAQFTPVTKETLKNNHWYSYTAYEYDGRTYYSFQYSGLTDENEFNKY
nr:hypothetical protein [uncultured Clostridium sp.]